MSYLFTGTLILLFMFNCHASSQFVVNNFNESHKLQLVLCVNRGAIGSTEKIDLRRISSRFFFVKGKHHLPFKLYLLKGGIETEIKYGDYINIQKYQREGGDCQLNEVGLKFILIIESNALATARSGVYTLSLKLQ